MDEAASIDVLCADKTGTLTQNELGGFVKPCEYLVRSVTIDPGEPLFNS